jgi:hypothetical protein
MFRFGDGTPFPLRENFIETLVAAVDCCVAIYQAEARVDEHHARQREAQRQAAEELRQLEALHGIIEKAVAPLIAGKGKGGGASAQAAARIVEATSTIIRNSRTGVAKRRDTATHEVLSPSALEGVPAALGQFFCHHQLPRTEWSAHWRVSAEGEATTELIARATRELELLFRGTPAADSFWARPVPMAELFGGPVTATVEAGKGRPRQIRLDPTTLTEVQVGPGREGMLLRDSPRRGSAGYHILMPRAGEAAPLVVVLDKNDQSRGQPFYLDAVSAAAVLGVWRGLEREVPSLVASRQELAAARLAGRDVSEIEHPGQLAEAILMPLAPLVREMRMRSRVPGELILKRDLGADRREEMFVPRQVLWNKLARLSPRHRQLFEAIGLSNEVTHEFVARVSQKSERPRGRPLFAGAEPAPERADLPTVESFGFERDPDLIEQRREPSRVPRTPPPPPAPAARLPAETTAVETTGEEGVSEVELTHPRGEDPEVSEVSVVSGIIERATA